MGEDTSNKDLKEKLDKMSKKIMESREMSVESLRRQQVAQVKLYGWLIEWIESQRAKLQKRQVSGPLIGIAQKTIDFRNQVLFEYLSLSLERTRAPKGIAYFSHMKSLAQTIPKMLEVYEKLRSDLVDIFGKSDAMVNSLPSIKYKGGTVPSYLQQLNICLGQMFG